MSTSALDISATEALGAQQLRVIIVCFVVAMVDGFDTLMLAYIAPLLSQTWDLSHGGMGKLFGIGYLGAVFGGFCMGPISDRIGRKRALIASLLIIATFTLLGSQAGSPGELMIYRLFAGLGLGGAIPCITALTAENVPASRRTSMVTAMFLGFPIGAVVGGGITAFLLTRFDWPAIFIVGGVAAIACILLTTFLVPASVPGAGRHAQSPFSTLGKQFADGRGPATVMLWITAFCVMTVTYFMVSWTPTVLHLTGMDLHKADTASLSVNIGGIVGALLIATLVGRRSPFICAACFLLVGTLVVCAIGASLQSTALAVIAFFFAGFGVIGGQLILPAMAARLFPASVRGAGVGALMGIGRIGSIAGPMIGGLLLSMELPWTYMYLIAAIPVAVAAMAVASAEVLRPREADEAR